MEDMGSKCWYDACFFFAEAVKDLVGSENNILSLNRISYLRFVFPVIFDLFFST